MKSFHLSTLPKPRFGILLFFYLSLALVCATHVTAQSPNLAVTNLAWSGVPTAGQSLSVTWAVTNLGSGFAAGNWYDRLYFSTNGLLNGTIASWYASSVNFHNITPGGSYPQSANALLPSVPPGTYYLIAQADADSVVFEGNETDNTQTRTITVVQNNLAVTNLAWSGVPTA